MKFKVERKWLKEDYTIGNFYIDYEDNKGWQLFCNTLEDKVRGVNEPKVYGETAIPYGKYKIIWAFSPKFQKLMPLLVGVPGFKGILIHIGNKKSDTLGCILVGENKIKGGLINSKDTFIKLYKLMEDSKQKEFIIEIE